MEQGERVADRLAALFDAHHERLYRLALRMISDPEEARELVQEAFLRVARRPRSLPADEAAGEAWLVRIVVNLCRDRRRRRKVRDGARAELPSSAAAPSAEAASVARLSVAAALSDLPARRRAVVVLAELEGRTSAEIAELLGISRVTVRWHLAAGRKELARKLAPLTADPTGDRS